MHFTLLSNQRGVHFQVLPTALFRSMAGSSACSSPSGGRWAYSNGGSSLSCLSQSSSLRLIVLAERHVAALCPVSAELGSVAHHHWRLHASVPHLYRHLLHSDSDLHLESVRRHLLIEGPLPPPDNDGYPIDPYRHVDSNYIEQTLNFEC